MCIHFRGFTCWRLYSLPLMIAPLSAAGENHSLKPAGVYEYVFITPVIFLRSSFAYGCFDAGIDIRLNIPGTYSYFADFMVARTFIYTATPFFLVIIIIYVRLCRCCWVYLWCAVELIAVLAVSSSKLVFLHW